MSQERNVVQLSNVEDYKQFVSNNSVVIIKASAKWCGPCKTIQPFFAEKISQLPTKVSIIFIDINDAPSLSRKLSIRAVPCIMSIINGQPCDVIVGANKDKINNFINKLKKQIGI